MTSLIEVQNLCAYYNKIEVLHGINFSMAEGSVVALLGANGAGKSTILRAICSMVDRTGSILIDGRSTINMKTEEIVRLGVAHVPEGRGTFVSLTVEENLQLGAITRRARRAIVDDIERIYSYFPRLKERRRQQAGTLSGGEQQMLAVGRGLMLRPRLLLLDEPSFGLGPMVVTEIFNVFRLLNHDEHVSMLIVEQDAQVALSLADQAYVIETGSIVLSGPPEVVGSNEEIRRAYLGY